MSTRASLLSMFVCGALLAFACNSDPGAGGAGGAGGGTGGSSGGAGGACLGDFGPGACQIENDCLDAQCTTEMNAIQDPSGPCADLVTCVAACNCDMTCTHQCEGNLSTSCQTAYANAVVCQHSKCASASCPDGETGGSGGTGGTGGAAGAAGAPGGGAAGVAGTGGTGTGDAPYSCYFDQGGQCTQGKANPALFPMVMATCASAGGVWGTMCPTDNVIGCCVNNAASCYYSTVPHDVGKIQAGCVQAGGEWVASPP